MHIRIDEHRLDVGPQCVHALAGGRRNDMRIGCERMQTLAFGIVNEVGLVEHGDHRQSLHTVYGLQHLVHRVDLRERIGVRGIDHVHDEVGVCNLLKRRFERLHQISGQPAYETDGVHIGIESAVARLRAAHRRVEGGEQRVLHQFGRTGQPVGQRRFAGIRVTDDGDGRQSVTSA